MGDDTNKKVSPILQCSMDDPSSFVSKGRGQFLRYLKGLEWMRLVRILVKLRLEKSPNKLPWFSYIQCDKIGRFIGLWQQLICQNLSNS